MLTLRLIDMAEIGIVASPTAVRPDAPGRECLVHPIPLLSLHHPVVSPSVLYTPSRTQSLK